MLGYSREELLGMPTEQMVARESRDLVRRRVEAGYPGLYEYLALRKDGSVFPVEAQSRRARYQGRAIRITAVRDISERLAAEQALAASELRFRAVFERAALGMVLLDLDGHPIESNPALQAMLGYSAEELRHLPCTAFTDPDDMAAEPQLFQELIAGQRESYQIEKWYAHKDGRTVCGNLCVSLIRDVEGGRASRSG